MGGLQGEARQKMYRFGEEYFPAHHRDAYQWKDGSEDADFKGIQVLLPARPLLATLLMSPYSPAV
jgi:hypothetical protein